MNVYVDASVLVALLTEDPLTARADMLLRDKRSEIVLSDFAGAEFASVIARRVRMGDHTADDARAAFVTLELWSSTVSYFIETTSADIRVATNYLRRLDVTPRAPDAINIAIAERAGAALATFDAKMIVAARRLGLGVLDA